MWLHGLLIAAFWVGGLFLLKRAGDGLPWHEPGRAPSGQQPPRGHAEQQNEKQASDQKLSTARVALVSAVAAVATLIAGVLLERSRDECRRLERPTPSPRLPRPPAMQFQMTSRTRGALLIAVVPVAATVVAACSGGGSADGRPTANASTSASTRDAGPCFGYSADGGLSGPAGCTPPTPATVPAGAEFVPCPEPTAPTGRPPQTFVCYLGDNGQLMGVEVGRQARP